MRILNLIFAILYTLNSVGQVHVKGYIKSNGTYVAPYTRSNSNSSPYDNYSFPGNTNPYTGKTATGNADTYIDNLYNKSTSSKSKVWVNDYYRRDGTFVSGHLRSSPNEDIYDNLNYTASRYTETMYVKTTTLNVRKGAAVNYSVLRTLSYGDQVVVIGDVNSRWTKIKVLCYGDDDELITKNGYVYSDYISSDPLVSAPNSLPFPSLEGIYDKVKDAISDDRLKSTN